MTINVVEKDSFVPDTCVLWELIAPLKWMHSYFNSVSCSNRKNIITSVFIVLYILQRVFLYIYLFIDSINIYWSFISWQTLFWEYSSKQNRPESLSLWHLQNHFPWKSYDAVYNKVISATKINQAEEERKEVLIFNLLKRKVRENILKKQRSKLCWYLEGKYSRV